MKDTIVNVIAREVLDSRGIPTIEAEIHLADGSMGRAIVPSGASTGSFEALELRDKDPNRYFGKGVKKAVFHVNTMIKDLLVGLSASDYRKVDQVMIQADQTKNKANLGANAILACSLACVKAASISKKIPLYQMLSDHKNKTVPIPMMNIINGGMHASNNIDIQEFMIMPIQAPSFHEGLRWCSEVFHQLKQLLKQDGHITSVGDEGGFAPNLTNDEEAITYILKAIKQAGYIAGKDFMIALDAAASGWKQKDSNTYILPKSKKHYTTDELVNYWISLVAQYPIISIEDGLDEEDWNGWTHLTKALSDQIQLVGDDLFVTNIDRLQKGIQKHCGNTILIKYNQIGTVSETIDTIHLAQANNYRVILSHRSGESEDTSIADFAVALHADAIKAGAPNHSERVAKYNQLLRIEEQLQAEKNRSL